MAGVAVTAKPADLDEGVSEIVRTLNAVWHREHPMPKNPSLEDRVRWHEEHAAACGCREIPPSVQKEIRRRARPKG